MGLGHSARVSQGSKTRIRILMHKKKVGQPGIAGWSSHGIFVEHEFESSQDQRKKLQLELLWLCLKVDGNGHQALCSCQPGLKTLAKE